MDLTTVENCKLYMTETTGDPLLSTLVTWVSKAVEQYLDREAETTSRTEYFDVERYQALVSVRAYPITSVTSITNDSTRAFTGSAMDSDDYTFYADGRIAFDYFLEPGNRALKVVYTGGLGATQAAVEASYPDLVQAVTLQVVHEWRRKKTLAEDTATLAQGSITPGGSMNWLPHVRAILDFHRRPYAR